jgi:hypothetical protein
VPVPAISTALAVESELIEDVGDPGLGPMLLSRAVRASVDDGGTFAHRTYGNIAEMFGGALADRERPVYCRVTTRSGGSTRGHDGGAAWLAEAASRPMPTVVVPDKLPSDRYLT